MSDVHDRVREYRSQIKLPHQTAARIPIRDGSRDRGGDAGCLLSMNFM